MHVGIRRWWSPWQSLIELSWCHRKCVQQTQGLLTVIGCADQIPQKGITSRGSKGRTTRKPWAYARRQNLGRQQGAARQNVDPPMWQFSEVQEIEPLGQRWNQFSRNGAARRENEVEVHRKHYVHLGSLCSCCVCLWFPFVGLSYDRSTLDGVIHRTTTMLPT